MSSMGTSVDEPGGASQAPSGARGSAQRGDHAGLLALRLLQQVLSRPAADGTRWTHEALAAYMGLSRSYVSRVLSGEKPLSLEFIYALPDDVQCGFHAVRLEAFGAVAIEPVSGDEAVRQLASALFGLLRVHPLGGIAPRMVKASLPAGVHEDRRRA